MQKYWHKRWEKNVDEIDPREEAWGLTKVSNELFLYFDTMILTH
jgi:hypothetical protein